MFVVETGAGLSTATSYVDTAEADVYFSSIGEDGWAGTVDEKQLALNRATRSVDLLFGQRFTSYPSYPNVQGLLFPRATFIINHYQIVAQNTIPRLLKEAVCEVALLALNGEDIYPNMTDASSLSSEKVKIGDLQFDTQYSGTTTYENLAGFYKIELMIGPLLSSSVNGYVPSYLSL